VKDPDDPSPDILAFQTAMNEHVLEAIEDSVSEHTRGQEALESASESLLRERSGTTASGPRRKEECDDAVARMST
jgi:hypothetical protein